MSTNLANIHQIILLLALFFLSSHQKSHYPPRKQSNSNFIYNHKPMTFNRLWEGSIFASLSDIDLSKHSHVFAPRCNYKSENVLPNRYIPRERFTFSSVVWHGLMLLKECNMMRLWSFQVKRIWHFPCFISFLSILCKQ